MKFRFEALYDELAKRETPWHLRNNIFSIYQDSAMEKFQFLNNWIEAFYNGIGLDPELKNYMNLVFNSGEPYNPDGLPKNIRTGIERHLNELLSARSLCLFKSKYPLALHDMMKKNIMGFYDNYGRWHEPDFSGKLKYGPNVSLFDLFDNAYLRSMLESRGIITIGSLCKWIDSNSDLIAEHKAGIGRVTAGILLDNTFIRHWCKDGLPALQKIAGKE